MVDSKNHNWSLQRKEIIPVSPERAWRALTNATELSVWWCDEATIDLVVGGEFLFRGSNVFTSSLTPGTSDVEQSCVLTEVVDGKRIQFQWPIGNLDTIVTFEVINRMELAEVRVTQTAPQAPCDWHFGDDRPNWWWIALPALRSFLETGSVALRLDYSQAQHEPPLSLSADFTTFPWVIWSKLTDDKEIPRWWGTDVVIDLRAGGQFTFASSEVAGPQKILAIEKESVFSHNWVWPDKTESVVTWKLEDTDNATRVSVTDHGPWPSSLRRDYHFIYWASALLYVKQMSERGVTPREYQQY